MSDYRDVLKEARIKGFIPDLCGTSERYYTWGSSIDLCGMSVEEAKKNYGGGGQGGGGDDTKTKNTITLSMQKSSDGTYHVKVSAEKASNSDVTVSFDFEGSGTQIVTIPAGSKEVVTDISSPDGNKYAEVTNIKVVSDDEQYKYVVKNDISDGYFTLTINRNGSTTTQSVRYDEHITLEKLDEKTGYDAVYTITTPSGTQVITDVDAGVTMPDANTTITEKYVPKDVTVHYSIKREELNGSDIPEAQVINSGENVAKFDSSVKKAVPSISAVSGYDITYQYNGSELTQQEFNAKLIDAEGDVYVDVLYALKKYEIKFVVGQTVVSDDMIYFTQPVTQPTSEEIESAVPTGYEFVEWSSAVPSTMPSHDVTINGAISPITYYIRYNVDGVEKYADAHIYGDAISIRHDEEKEGYTFSGWNPSSLPQTMPAQDINVYGTFSINQYTLTFNSDGTMYTSITADYGSQVEITFENPEKEGYTFVGWDNEVPSTMPSRDMEFNAEFEVNAHTLTYYVDGEVYSSFTYDYGTEITAIDEPSREGYEFSGWDSVPQTMPDNDVDVHGTFSILSYVLSYYVDGVLSESAEMVYGSEIVAKEEPEKEGYTFSGWSEIPNTMPAHDVDVFGTFTVNEYKVTYYVDGSEYAVDTYDYGESIAIREEPAAVEGYTFSGWTYDEFPQTMPSHDINVYGEYIINVHTLSFFVDSEPYTSITADYGTQISVTEPSASTGHHFEGWTDESGVSVSVPETMPDADISYYGKIVKNVWTASFYVTDQNGQRSFIEDRQFEYGEEITHPDVAVPTGYTLTWNDVYTEMPDNDITVEGVIEEIEMPHTVYYGFVKVSDESGATTSGLSTFEFESGVETNITFTLYGDEDYLNIETEEDIDRWMEEMKNDYVVFVPDETTVSLTDGLAPIPSKGSGRTVDVDGYTYRVFIYDGNGVTPLDTDQMFSAFITVTQN